MSRIPFVDCQGLAGAWTLGTQLTGQFELVDRKSLPGGFGDDAMRENAKFFPGNWDIQVGEQESWEPVHGIGYLCGTPPCSGFSLLNSSKNANKRGPDAAINSCMKDLVTYASKCTGLDGEPGPEIVSYESVQQAYSIGRPLIQALRNILERNTGQKYAITHVKMSGASVGNAQMRHRYYPVFHRIPFRIEAPNVEKVFTYHDAIGDLMGLKLQKEWQPYVEEPFTEYQRERWSDDGGVTDHWTQETTTLNKLLEEIYPYWNAGEDITKPLQRYYDEHGRPPRHMRDKAWNGPGVPDPNNPQKDLPIVNGWSWPNRVHPHKPGYVLTGGGIMAFVHYSEDRLLTARECSRLMGYPDDWTWKHAKSPMHQSMLIGKCCPVQSGKWISGWVAEAIQNYHGDASFIGNSSTGDVKRLEDGEDEYLHNSTNAYKPVLKKQLEELNA